MNYYPYSFFGFSILYNISWDIIIISSSSIGVSLFAFLVSELDQNILSASVLKYLSWI